MVAKKSNPPNRTKVRRPLDSIDSLRPSSLPPELASADMNWDDDAGSIREFDLLTDSNLDLDPDAGERTTEIPCIPMADLVAASMAEAEKKELEAEPATKGEAHENTRPSTPVPEPEERPTVEYFVPPRDIDRADAHTSPAPARRQNDFLRPSVPPGTEAPSRLSGTLANRSSSAPPRSSPSIGSLLEPSVPPLAFGNFDDRVSFAPVTTRSENDTLRMRMKDLYATGDFSGALEIAENLLFADSGDLEAQRFSTSCRDVLTQMLLSRVGPLDQVVQIALSTEELRWLTLDHRAGFILSLVDGMLSLEELLDITGMTKLESLRIIVHLLEQRVLRLVAR